jgi:hypothetical protein
MIQPWPKVGSQPVGDFRIFTIRSDRKVSPRTRQEHDFYVIDCSNWVNVIAVTPDDELVMIEQYRHGSDTIELEIPGGMIDPSDASPVAAQARVYIAGRNGTTVVLKHGPKYEVIATNVLNDNFDASPAIVGDDGDGEAGGGGDQRLRHAAGDAAGWLVPRMEMIWKAEIMPSTVPLTALPETENLKPRKTPFDPAVAYSWRSPARFSVVAPLSPRKKSSVFSSRPLRASASRMAPTPSSTAATIAA